MNLKIKNKNIYKLLYNIASFNKINNDYQNKLK